MKIKVVQVTILRHWDHASQTQWYEPRVLFYGSTETDFKISCDADATTRLAYRLLAVTLSTFDRYSPEG